MRTFMTFKKYHEAYFELTEVTKSVQYRCVVDNDFHSYLKYIFLPGQEYKLQIKMRSHMI